MKQRNICGGTIRRNICYLYLPVSSLKDSRGTPWNKPFLAISSAQSSNSAFLEKNKE